MSDNNPFDDGRDEQADNPFGFGGAGITIPGLTGDTDNTGPPTDPGAGSAFARGESPPESFADDTSTRMPSIAEMSRFDDRQLSDANEYFGAGLDEKEIRGGRSEDVARGIASNATLADRDAPSEPPDSTFGLPLFGFRDDEGRFRK